MAQLVGRLVWDQDAASSSLATRTIKAERAFALSAFIVYRKPPAIAGGATEVILMGRKKRPPMIK